MFNKKNHCSYESPNIVIVPTVSFLNGPPVKKIKLDNGTETTKTINNNNKEVKNNNNSWASNYLQSIPHSQIGSSSKQKIPIICEPDKGTECKKTNNGFTKNHQFRNETAEFTVPITKITNSKETLPSKMQIAKENVSIAQIDEPIHCFPIDSNLESYQNHSVLKICGTTIEDRDTHLTVATKMLKETEQNILTFEGSKSELNTTRDVGIQSNKRDSKSSTVNLIQKQKNTHADGCFNSELNTKNENSNCSKEDKKKIYRCNETRVHEKGNKAHHKTKLNSKAHANKDRKPSSQHVMHPVKQSNVSEIDKRVKSLLSSVFPVDNNKGHAEIRRNLKTKQYPTKDIRNMKQNNRIFLTDSASNNNVGKNLQHDNGKSRITDKSTPKNAKIINKRPFTNESHTATKNSKETYESKKKYVRSDDHRAKDTKVAKKILTSPLHEKHKPITNLSNNVSDSSHRTPHVKQVTKSNIKDDSNSGKILTYKMNSKIVVPNFFDLRQSLNSCKLVKLPSKSSQPVQLQIEDLRRKLIRKKKYRDNLIVSVPNDVTFDKDNKFKQELSVQNQSKKSTTIKLVINLVSSKSKEKSTENEPKITTHLNEREQTSVDLSFLDNFDIDDIVRSLNDDVNTCTSLKEDSEELKAKIVNVSEESHLKNITEQELKELKFSPRCENKSKLSKDEVKDEICIDAKQEMTQSAFEVSNKTDGEIYIASSTDAAIASNENTCSSLYPINIPCGKILNVITNIASNLHEPVIKYEIGATKYETEIEEESAKNILSESNHQNNNHKTVLNGSCADELFINDTTTTTDSFKPYDSRSKNNIQLTIPNQSTVQQLTSNKKSSNVYDDCQCFDLMGSGQHRCLKKQQINTDIAGTTNILLKSSKFNKNTGETKPINTFIDLTVPDYRTNQNMPSKTDFIDKNTIDKSTKSTSADDPLETNNKVPCIDLTQHDEVVAPITQQSFPVLAKQMSLDNDSPRQTNDLQKSALINVESPNSDVAEIETKSKLKTQNNCKETLAFKCDSLISKQIENVSNKNKIVDTNTDVTHQNSTATDSQTTGISVQNVVTKDLSEPNAANVEICSSNNENGHKAKIKAHNNCKEEINTEIDSMITKNENETEKYKVVGVSGPTHSITVSQSSQKPLQANNVKKPVTNMSDSKNQIKSTVASQIKYQGKSDKHVAQASTKSQKKDSTVTDSTVTAHVGLRKTPSEEVLSQTLKLRMLNYLGVNYDIGMLIRRGKYSSIFHCTDQKKKEYAVKVLHKAQDRYSLGIKKESMIMNMQKDIPKENQHFVYFVNGFGIEERWCFLMEYYPKNLRQVLYDENKGFHIDVIRKLSRQLVSAVIILRHNKIIHSDIKPEHILLNNSLDHLKLCGFDECRTSDQVILLPNIGTASYRAPEVILGYSDGFSIDVWSTALVMFEMATARKLFPGIYNNDILYKQMSVLGNIPFQMIESSIFKDYHFCGNETQWRFMRRYGCRGQNIVIIQSFSRFGITGHIFNAYQKFFPNGQTKDKAKDKQKLKSFCDLLQDMLVMDPKQRLPIEFVYANPFIYESSDSQ